MIKQILACVMIGISLTVSGCGGGSSSGDSTVKQGRFVDSEVQGVRFVTATQSGTTDASGSFSYTAGETVSFYVGDILLGQVTATPVITPVQLVSGATNETDPAVTNLARFLQTIDDDGNPDNGILVTQAVADLAAGSSIDFSQTTANFTNDGSVQTLVASMTAATTAGARSLVTSSQAQSHLTTTLFNAFSGSWSGTYGGGDSGTWNATISDTGVITATGTSRGYGSFTASGTLDTSGGANFATGSASTGASFSGTFDYSTGTASGVWGGFYENGTWSGSKN